MSDIKFGYTDEFRRFASNYYDVDRMIEWLERPLSPGWERWRCLGCGAALDVTHEMSRKVPATCCGACGYALMRPLAEWKEDELTNFERGHMNPMEKPRG